MDDSGISSHLFVQQVLNFAVNIILKNNIHDLVIATTKFHLLMYRDMKTGMNVRSDTYKQRFSELSSLSFP